MNSINSLPGNFGAYGVVVLYARLPLLFSVISIIWLVCVFLMLARIAGRVPFTWVVALSAKNIVCLTIHASNIGRLCESYCFCCIYAAKATKK